MPDLIKEKILDIEPGVEFKNRGNTYRISEYIDCGGSGFVYKATRIEMQEDVAIKFFLPRYGIEKKDSQQVIEDKLSKQLTLYKKEVKHLLKLNHPNVVRILDYGQYKIQESEIKRKSFQFIKELDYFVMDFVQGDHIDVFFRKRYMGESPRNKIEALSILSRLCDALIYLHDKEFMHADIRKENVIVRLDKIEPMLVDFALTKNFNESEVDQSGMTKLLCDYGLFPPEVNQSNSPLYKLVNKEIKRSKLKEICFPWLDLYQFGKLLELLIPLLAAELSLEELEYLHLIKKDLLAIDTVRHRDASWVKDRISKLSPSYTEFLDVEELRPPSSSKHTIQLPRRIVAISDLVDAIINTRSFRRLSTINQLAYIETLYPGATHRRSLHCLRTYEFCQQLIESLSHSPFFNFFFDPGVTQQALVVALLHDINHFPLQHAVRETKELSMPRKGILDYFCDGEEIEERPSIYKLLDSVGLSTEDFKAIIQDSYGQMVRNGYKPALQIIKSIIDGGVDVDKMAYLEDDSHYTGVPYGSGIDFARLISSATVVSIETGGRIGWHIGFKEEGVPAVESLLMARYWMYRTVYWNRHNRAITAMLLHILNKLYGKGRKGRFEEFLKETMWKSDAEVLEYLDCMHKRYFDGKESITKEILVNRSSIYRRVLSIQGLSTSVSQQEPGLYKKIRRLKESNQLDRYKLILITELNRKRIWQGTRKIGREDLLFDIPEKGGDQDIVYIRPENAMSSDSSRGVPIENFSESIKPVLQEFEKLSKRVRIFINPEIVDGTSEEMIQQMRPELLNLIEDTTQTPTKSRIT